MSANLTVLCSMATRHMLAELASSYHAAVGTDVLVRAAGGVEVPRLIRQGGNVDVIVLASAPLARLEEEGFVERGSVSPFAHSGIALAVRPGAPKPRIDSADAVRSAMSSDIRIGYSTGPSGDHLKMLWDRWGITDHVMQRAVKAEPGVPVAALLERGQVDLGLQQLSELIGHAGIDVLGPLPAEIQLLTTFSVAVARSTADADGAHRLVQFLTSNAAGATKAKHGMTAT